MNHLIKKISIGFKEKTDEYALLLGIITCFLVCIFGYFIIKKQPILVCNDQAFQYDVFYHEWIQLVKNLLKGEGIGSIMYSWEMFLGTDFFSAMGYYVVGDIFLPILLLIDNVKIGLIIEMVLCFYISGIGFYRFLNELGIKSKNTKVFISVVYTFGGWSILYFGQYLFMRFYAFLPFLFYGVEKYFRRNKRDAFTIYVAILFLQNFYLMWPTSIFLFIYCITRTIEDKKSIKEIISNASNLIIAYIVGFLMSLIVVLPSVIYTLSNPRVGHITNQGVFWGMITNLNLLICSIIPAYPVVSNVPNIFYIHSSGYDYWLTLFVSTIPMIGFTSFIFKKENKCWRISSILLLIMMFIKPFSSLMHGFSEPSLRWIVVVEFLILLLAAKGLDSEKLNYKPFTIYLIVVSFLIMYICFFMVNLEEYKYHVASIVFSLIVAVIVFVFYRCNKKISILLCVLQLLFYSILMVGTWNSTFYKSYERINNNEVRYYQDMDSDKLYRYYIPQLHINPYSELNLNRSLIYDMMTAKTYNTMLDPNTSTLMNLLGLESHIIDIQDYETLKMLGTKYYVVYDASELPSDNFEYMYNLSDLKVFKDNSYKGFSRTFSNIESMKSFESTLDFDDTLFIDEDKNFITKNEGLDEKELIFTKKENNSFAGNISLKTDNILLIPIPNNKGWKIVVDGLKTETIGVNGGLMGVPLQKGEHTIEGYFITPGLKTGSVLTSFGIITFLIMSCIENKRRYLIK